MPTLPRSLVIVALVGLLLACAALPWLGGSITRTAAMRGLAERSLDELALLAGVRDDQGQLQRDEAMPLEVIQDGGSLWIQPTIEQAVDASAWFDVGKSPHLLRIEAIDDPRALALQLHLWRAGWELRSPEPLRVRVTPYVIVIAGLLGAIAATLTRRPSLGLSLWGVLAQVLLVVLAPPPQLFPPQTLWAEWSRGPLLGRVLPRIQAMTPLELAIAVAVISLCLVLVAFDHRRSRAGEHSLDLGTAGLSALLGTLGVLLIIEAASRSSYFAAQQGWPGWLATLGLALAWVPVLELVRRQWLQQRELARASEPPAAADEEPA